ncbi:MAG: prepilin-type N-terminal cleavage/methylation domain-containing protein [Campylobacterales bacterium]|nr:prepilin-type N-terminal cleavage/methylation domain-containing protein [Campylobacterales bacterium]
MKKAFTLIELMISIILLSIIVTFLYQAVAQLQHSNQRLLARTDEVDRRENILKLLYNDFINARSLSWREKRTQTDRIVLQTSNSLHDMSEPYVHYRVYRDEKSLRRIESPAEELNYERSVFRFDTVLQGVESFKVYESRGHCFIYLKSEGMEEIYLDILPPSMAFKSQADANKSAESNTSNSERDEEEVEVQDEQI